MMGTNLAFADSEPMSSDPPGRAPQPGERLMIAVLEQARADLQLPRAALPRVEALRWLHSDDESWPLSFARISRHFGIDPAAARAALLGAS